MANLHKIVVGLDFGTTYSALAWASTNLPGQINLIGNWPSAGILTHHSAPTEIAYHEGSTTDFSWGYDIPRSVRRLKWFKLLLESNDDHVQSGVPLPPGMTAMDVTRDYLSALYQHAISTLWRQNGHAVMSMTRVDFVLTVPAVWSDTAKQRTREAAISAGMSNEHDLSLLSEPEAAAIYTIKNQDTHAINVHDRIVVCDAGGGTVDLISYTVLSINPLRVTECAVGTGGFCGSTYIDRNFELLLKRRMGHHYDNMRVETQQRIVKSFEEVKCAFRDNPDQNVYHVGVPAIDTIPEAGIYGGEFQLTREEMRQLFDPIVDQIMTLINGQIQSISREGYRVNSVLLVGGFGESPATAVVKGAVLRGLESSIPLQVSAFARRARRHYGTPMSTPFVPGRHSDRDAYTDPITGRKMARNQVSWFLQKGELITDDRRITRNFCRTFKKYSGPWVDSMVACDLDRPPSRVTQDVMHICNITADLSSVSKSSYEKKWKGWKKFYIARYNLDLSISSGDMKFELIFRRASFGSITVDFEL
ncbi:actin-like ATPase domain-containing protein [Choiromyces venosus 120613-1]|uniref:Actin-like ATPase domain-containing protein n=1 Tax=Choiromyces venosus 120613-1 TaxID=1336337 RepID=A0A3N4JTB7_9PEZI|nr:actin-like ATPase domain-containing protein [Choiromyces venosus 120613-1]